tara:strand:+ start:2336 stop:3661 length:1326 start_codon:yes stop_codon:yes gene_type:complete
VAELFKKHIKNRDYILDKPVKQTDFLQFTPATISGVVNSSESVINPTMNPGQSNMITVKPNIWTPSDTLIRLSNTKKYKPIFRGFADSVEIGDSVLITMIGGEGFYIGPINVGNSPTSVTDNNLVNDITNDKNEVTSDDMSGKSSINSNITHRNRLTKEFNVDLDDPTNTLKRKKHPVTGRDVFTDILTDMTMEGRYGNSINIGSRNIFPHIFISNGRDGGQTTESINDSSIFGMIEFGTISQHFNREQLDDIDYEFKLADESIADVKNSIKGTYRQAVGRGNSIGGEDDTDIDTTIYGFDKPQTFLNSERITINARKENLFLSAFQHIHLGSGNTMTFSTSKNTLFNTADTFIVNSPKVKIGSQVDEETEPLVLGDTLKDKLDELCTAIDGLITALNSHTHPSPAGPTGPPVAPFQPNAQAISSVKGALQEILSTQNRTT